jgi:hypothetical protein
MFEVRDPGRCERKRLRQDSYSNQTFHPPLKRRKLDRAVFDAQNQPPTTFWDSLSKIWLTKRALKELDRRNAGTVGELPCFEREDTKRLTRGGLAEWKRRTRPASVPAFGSSIKRFARHGGPDLLDLRGAGILY